MSSPPACPQASLPAAAAAQPAPLYSVLLLVPQEAGTGRVAASVLADGSLHAARCVRRLTVALAPMMPPDEAVRWSDWFTSRACIDDVCSVLDQGQEYSRTWSIDLCAVTITVRRAVVREGA